NKCCRISAGQIDRLHPAVFRIRTTSSDKSVQHANREQRPAPHRRGGRAYGTQICDLPCHPFQSSRIGIGPSSLASTSGTAKTDVTSDYVVSSFSIARRYPTTSWHAN